MTTEAVPPKRRGRPPVPPEQRASTRKPQRSIRLAEEPWELLREFGTEWLEQALLREKRRRMRAGT